MDQIPDQPTPTASPSAALRKKKLPLIVAVFVLVVVILGAATYWFFRPANLEGYKNEVYIGTTEDVLAGGVARDERIELCKEKARLLPQDMYSFEGDDCLVTEKYRREIYEQVQQEVAQGDVAENWSLVKAYEREGAVYLEVQDYLGPYGEEASGCSSGDEPFSRTGTRGHITWFDCIKNSSDETYWYKQREPFPVITVQLENETIVRNLSGSYYDHNYFTLTPLEYLSTLPEDLPSPSFTVNLISKDSRVLFLHESWTQ